MGLDIDLDFLVETITNEILKRLGSIRPKRVLVGEGCPADIVSREYEPVSGQNLQDCGYVLLTAEAYKALTCAAPLAPAAEICEAGPDCGEDLYCPEGGKVIALGAKRLLHERDLRDNNARRGDTIKISKKTIITALAADYAKSIGVKIIREG